MNGAPGPEGGQDRFMSFSLPRIIAVLAIALALGVAGGAAVASGVLAKDRVGEVQQIAPIVVQPQPEGSPTPSAAPKPSEPVPSEPAVTPPAAVPAPQPVAPQAPIYVDDDDADDADDDGDDDDDDDDDDDIDYDDD